MRTTLTLDNDVVKKVEDKIRKTGKSAQEVYNELLRDALSRVPVQKVRPFSPPLFSGREGLMPGFSWDMPLSQTLDKLDEAEWIKLP